MIKFYFVTIYPRHAWSYGIPKLQNNLLNLNICIYFFKNIQKYDSPICIRIYSL